MDPSGEGVLVQVLESGVVENLRGVDPFLELGAVRSGAGGLVLLAVVEGAGVELEASDVLGEVLESAGDAVEVVEDPGIAPCDSLHASEGLLLIHRSTPFVLFFRGGGGVLPLSP